MQRSKKIDIGIITIKPEVELFSILRAFNLSLINQEPKLIDGCRYWFTTIISKKLNKKLKVVITATGTPGNEASSNATTNLIKHFNPNLLVLVGIAAGIRGKVNLLDVVVSERVLGYEPGRLTLNGMKQRPPSEHPPFSLLQDARFFKQYSEDKGWLELYETLQSKLKQNQLPPDPPPKKLKVNIATIASGEKLFADGSLYKIREQYDEKIRAGEMEGIGFAIAAERNRIPWIIIRGISDFGDPPSKNGKYKDRYQFSAANSASSWTVKFLENAYSNDNTESKSVYKGEISNQILEKIKSVIAIHGLDDDNWTKAMSSQYFLVGIARLLNMTDQQDYKNLLNKFLSSFHLTIDNKIILDKSHLLITPEETERIYECMRKEDEEDKYYSSIEKTKAGYIDPSLLHYNYLYGLTLKISSSKKYEVLHDIHQLAINELLYGKNGKAIDDHGGWYPYRVPWVTARILTSFKEANYLNREDVQQIEKTIHKALESLIRRIYMEKYWRSGVGIWVSQWESTSLSLEALDKWDYIIKHKSKIKKILTHIIENESDWMINPPNFETEEVSNNTLASIVLICVLLKIIEKYFDTNEFSLDYDKYLRYLNSCIETIDTTPDPNNRQFCTIPQIAYYIIDLLSNSDGD